MTAAAQSNAMPRQIKTVYDLLRTSQQTLHTHQSSLNIPKTPEPKDLPQYPPVTEIEEAVFTPKVISSAPQPPPPPSAAADDKPYRAASAPQQTPGWLQRDLVKYPLIFVVAFAFFYVFLNFGALYDKFSATFHKTAPAPQTQGQVLGVSTPEYDAWIKKYFYAASNQDALSPNNDYDHDGLTNYQEYLLGTNPINPDTDGDGVSDGQEILNGTNPLLPGDLLTPEQQGIIQGWDLQLINERLSYYVTQTLAAGPAKPSTLPLIKYDLTRTGEVEIPKLGLKAPLHWPNSADEFTNDLNNGLIHYPGTSLPGQAGVSYISGHSSNYIWIKSDFSHIFTRINELDTGDEFFVTVPEAGGQTQTLRYVVTDKNEFNPSDQQQFTSAADNSVVNLSTCWPIGSTAKRLVVSGKLMGV